MNQPPRLPLTQYVDRPGIIDLGWGHPDPDLLPTDGIRAAANHALERFGPDALGYGHNAGPGPLLEAVCERLAVVDGGRTPDPAAVLITAGNSWAIDQVATLLTRPGDVVLVESPTYHLAVKILREHPVRLVPIPVDEGGLVVDAIPGAIRAARAGGARTGVGGAHVGAGAARTGAGAARVRLLYTVPTFNNPTGISLADDRRRALVSLAEREGFLVLEDDAYRELAYDDPAAPPSLWSIAAPGVVVRLGSFSKSLAPGLRVGYLTADAATVASFADGGVLDSGGGISHFSALVVAEFLGSGEFVTNVARLRDALRERRDALVGGLAAFMPDGTRWTAAQGGYFVWVTLPPGSSAGTLLPVAEAAGTSFMPGSAFHLRAGGGGEAGGGEAGGPAAGPGGSTTGSGIGPGDADRSLRLSFSRFSPDQLREAARRLGQATRDAPTAGVDLFVREGGPP